jgi:hypothetical protein
MQNEFQLSRILFRALPIFAVLIFLPTIFFDFAYDDFFQIVQHPKVNALSGSFHSVFFAFSEPTFPGDLFRPLTVTSYRVTALLFGVNPFPHHIINILLFGGCVFLLGEVLRVAIPKREMATLFALIWFTVHPVHIEAVANIVGRAELFAAFFTLGSLLMYQRSRTERSAFLLGFSILSYAAACLSKESALTALPLILLFPCFFESQEQRNDSRSRAALVCFLLITVMLLFYRWIVLKDLFIQERDLHTYYAENPLLQEPFLARVFPALKILGDAILLLLFPLRLSADYSSPHHLFWSEVHSLSGYISVGVVFLYLSSLFVFRSKRFVFFGLWPVFTLSLTSNILTPIGTIMGERLLFLPSMGFCIYISCIGYTVFQRFSLPERSRHFLIASFLGFHLFQLTFRLPIWQNNATLFRATVVDNPKSPKAYLNLGMHLYHKDRKYEEAERGFRKALELESGRVEYFKNLINALIMQQKFGSAEYWTKKALEKFPKNQDLQEVQEKLLALKGHTSEEVTGNSE